MAETKEETGVGEMAGGKIERDPAKLVAQCESFMKGAKKLYDEGPGDMWFFELYHHLNDCAAVLRSNVPAVTSQTRETIQNPDGTTIS